MTDRDGTRFSGTAPPRPRRHTQPHHATKYIPYSLPVRVGRKHPPLSPTNHNPPPRERSTSRGLRVLLPRALLPCNTQQTTHARARAGAHTQSQHTTHTRASRRARSHPASQPACPCWPSPAHAGRARPGVGGGGDCLRMEPKGSKIIKKPCTRRKKSKP